MNLSKNSNKLSKLLAVIMTVVMVFGALPCVVLAEDAQSEALYLKSLTFGSKAKPNYELDSPLEDGKFEYTVTVPVNTMYIMVSYVRPELSEAAPEGSIVTVDYTDTKGNVITGASATSILKYFNSNNPSPDTIKVNVGTDADKQVFTIRFIKEFSLNNLFFVDDEDGGLLLKGAIGVYRTHGDALRPGDRDVTLADPNTRKDYSIGFNETLTFSGVSKCTKKDIVLMSINGQEVKADAKVDVAPVWDNETKTGVFTVESQVGLEDVSSVTYTVRVRQAPDKLVITKAENKHTYFDGAQFSKKGFEITAYYHDGTNNPINLDECTFSPSIFKMDTTEVTIDYYGCRITQPITVVAVSYDPFDGKGTEDKPYLIKNQDDLVLLSALSAKYGCIGKYFKMVEDITLPDDWTPIGAGNSIAQGAAPFAGTFDGDGHLLTVPEGGLPLFGFTREAVIKNLDIFGKQIDGYGLINNYTVDYGESGKYDGNEIKPATIQNVTLKSGSRTLKSGFIGGYASGINAVYIDNCTIEKGVTIGYDKSQSNIGGFGGEYTGFITNSKCYADIYGVDFVGGIIADKGQTMGPVQISNCFFGGTVNASGNYAGGISGAGYGGTNFGIGSAPNTPCISIINCEVTGTIVGKNYVGGILGAEPGVVQCWTNGSGIIKDNVFSGKVSATDEDAYIGGIVGYLNSINKLNVIENNRYVHGCGVKKGIGFIKIIDTNNPNVADVEGVLYFNTEGKTQSEVAQMYPGMLYPDYNRTDDPLGADAEKLAKSFYSEKQLDDMAKADAVESLIDAIGEVTLDSGKAIETAEGAYDALTEDQKALVENLDTLTKARADYNRLKAEYVEGLIEKLPKADEITLKDGDNVKAAGDAYDKLTEDQKKLVSADSVKKLESVRAAYAKIAPKTGDSMSIAIYALLLVVAAATGTVVYKKKKKA